MILKIDTTNVIHKTIKRDIEFPYYGWYSHKKDGIVRLTCLYDEYKPNRLVGIKCVKISHGFGLNSSITEKTISVFCNTVHEDIVYVLRDYADIATEKEFNEFKDIVITSIIN